MIDLGKPIAAPCVTVTTSEVLTAPDGTKRLCLHTKEAGSIAFSIDEQTIHVIHGHLTKIELGLRKPEGLTWF